jgi:uncharacterized damage-inducible protein DinB
MKVDMAQEVITYNTWANMRVLDAVSRVAASDFTRVLGGSYPSLQSTLTHMLWVEWLWLERWQGNSPQELFAPEDFPSILQIASRWRQIHAGQQSFVQSLTPADLERVIRYTNRAGEEWEYTLARMIYHLINHSTYHRGQVTNMLRLLNASPAKTDFLEWWDEGR